MAEPEDDKDATPPKARKAKKQALPEAEERPELPSAAAVRRARKAELEKWLEESGLPTEGRVPELRERLREHIEAQGEAAPSAAPAKPTKARPPKAKRPKEPEKEAEREKEEEEPARKPAYRARAKPALAAALKRALALRRTMARRRPRFLRQEWYRNARLGRKWRRPQGGQSKLRRHFGYRINVVSIGYRSPRLSRGLHPSGFAEILVHNVRQLEGVDGTRQAVRVAHAVGYRKRVEIQGEADKRGIRVLNPVEVVE